MRYLCSTHQSQLFSQSCEQQSAIWLDWIMRAAVFYQRQYWQDALPFLGCGFELSCHLLSCETNDKASAAVRMSLSAIYLHNVLRQCNQELEAQAVIHKTIDQLLAQKVFIDHEPLISMLLTPDRHQYFFNQYFNLPYQPIVNTKAVYH